MDIEDHRETFARLSAVLGTEMARQVTDELDEERMKAKKKLAERQAEIDCIRAIVRQEFGLLFKQHGLSCPRHEIDERQE